MILSQPRCTTDYRIGGPVTFRRASKKKHVWGTNLQNPTKAICSLYHADPGMELCQCDQSGADAKIVSYLTRCGPYRQLFLNKVKPHIYIALHLFPDEWKKAIDKDVVDRAISSAIPDIKNISGWPELSALIASSDNWPAERRYYFVGKKVGHSCNYAMRGNTFRKDLLKESGGTIALSNNDAEKFIRTYHELFPEIQNEFHFGIRETILNGRTLRTFQGFPRYFGSLINDKLWREAYAFIPAATVAIITAQAITSMQNFIEDNNMNWHLLNDKHDSMLTEAPVDEIMLCAKKSKEFMEQRMTSHLGEELQMGAACSVGRNWGSRSTKNPEGLEEVKV